MKCQFCGQDLPEGAKFCYKCKKQIACLICGAKIESEATICVFCGNTVGAVKGNPGPNTIRYTETESGRSFEAVFSDGTASNVAAVFSRFIPELNANTRTVYVGETKEMQARQAIEYHDEAKVVPQNRLKDIDKLFSVKDDSIQLVEKRLKGVSKIDQQGRACLLFLLYYHEHGMDAATREQINAFLSAEGLYDNHVTQWLSQHSSFFVVRDNTFTLSRGGLQIAEQYLSEALDDSIDQKWNHGTAVTPSGRGKNKSVIGLSSNKSSDPIFLDDLDLFPKNQESLADFLNKYKHRKSSLKLNLLFVYYLKQIRNINKVDQNHLFTCYRAMKFTLPKNLYHSISDTISKNHWLKEISDLKITSVGFNEVEQNMLIK